MIVDNVDMGAKATTKEEVYQYLVQGEKCFQKVSGGFLKNDKYLIFIPTKNGGVMVNKYDEGSKEYGLKTRIGKNGDIRDLVNRVL